MTIDLEDWFCVANLSHAIKKQDWPAHDLRVGASTAKLLDVLDAHETVATFFVLGWVAERLPDLVREISDRGHEVASHGYSHRLVTEQTPDEFTEDLRRALEVTRACVDREVIGYRAPSFSITRETLWAIDILKANGIKYDSSIYPIGLHPDYGIPESPLSVHRLKEGLTEVPLSCTEFFSHRFPCSGGGYFRLYPYWISRYLLRRCNRQGRPIVFYLHPWEVDPEQPRVAGLPFQKRFRHYVNLDKTLDRFSRLLSEFNFTSIQHLLDL
jgi:polysaccharide deacetylase family protein (PEP-CTERM system associated)